MTKEQKDLLRDSINVNRAAGDALGAEYADAIEAALKEVERGRWIPLSERKPEENQYVLLWSPGPWLRLAYWSSFVGSEATHWMLPQEDPNEPNEAA